MNKKLVCIVIVGLFIGAGIGTTVIKIVEGIEFNYTEIEPTWCETWGGSSTDYARCMLNINNDPIIGVNTYSDSNDVFIARYNNNGGRIWDEILGGSETEVVTSLTTDENREIITNDFLNYTTQSKFYYNYLESDWWPMYRHDLNRSGYSTSSAPNTNEILWSFKTGSDIYGTSPAVIDGRVYIGSNDYKIYCLDSCIGNHIWNYTTNSYVVSSPAVAYGKVYVGSNDNKLYCLDAYTGSHIWNYTANHDVGSSPAVVDNKVYVGSYDHNMYCLDADTGSEIWIYTAGGIIQWSSPTISNGKIYFGSGDGKLYCLDADNGSYIWDYTTGGNVESTPAIKDNKIYFGSLDDNVYCLEADTGSFVWNYTMDSGSASSPAVAYGKVYIGSSDDRLYCLDADNGSHLWNYTTGHWIQSTPAVADHKIYVGSLDGNLYCFDADTCNKIWNYSAGGVLSSPAIAKGRVYVGGWDDNVYCFGVADIDVQITSLLSGWNLVSLPFKQTIFNSDIFINNGSGNLSWNGAVASGIISNFVFGWNRSFQTYNFADILEPGFGYWIYAFESCELWIKNITLNYNNYITDVEQNWNIISVPYNQSVNKADIIFEYLGTDYVWSDAVTLDLVSNYLFGWNRDSQSYGFVDTLMPGYAYWMYVYQPCTLKRAI